MNDYGVRDVVAAAAYTCVSRYDRTELVGVDLLGWHPRAIKVCASVRYVRA